MLVKSHEPPRTDCWASQELGFKGPLKGAVGVPLKGPQGDVGLHKGSSRLDWK